MKALVVILFVLSMIPLASATTVDIQPSYINLTLNGTIQQKLNVTVDSNFSGVLYLNLDLPFVDADIQPNTITYSNGTNIYYPVFSAQATDSFPSRIYTGFLNYQTGLIYNSIDIAIDVIPKKYFDIEIIDDIDVVNGDSGTIIINVTNTGNIDLKLNLSSNSTFVEPSVSETTIFRQQQERLYWFYRIPMDLQPKVYNAKISINENDYLIEFDVKDTTIPKIIVTVVPHIKVNEPYIIEIEATDNIKLEDVYTDIICADVAAKKYDFMRVHDNTYQADIDALPKPTECTANIYAIDESDNQNLTQIYYSTDYLYGVSYKTAFTVPKFRTEFLKKYRIVESNETINVTIKLSTIDYDMPNVTNNESFYFTLGVDNGNQIEMFGANEGIVTLTGKVFYLNFQSNIIGPFEGKVLVTLPEYTVRDNQIEMSFSGEVGRYQVADPYQGGKVYGGKIIPAEDFKSVAEPFDIQISGLDTQNQKLVTEVYGIESRGAPMPMGDGNFCYISEWDRK